MNAKKNFQGVAASAGLKYCSGIQALKTRERTKITVRNPDILQGSIALDEDLSARYPNEARWDYVIASYVSENRLDYVEIHPATSKEVKKVLEKYRWLRGYLRTEGKVLTDFCSEKKSHFHWVASGKIESSKITKSSPKYRELAKYGLTPRREVSLSCH